MKTTETNSDRLRALEDENAELRRQLGERQNFDEDLYSYRVFVEARKKMFSWIAGAAVILTAFGIYSLRDVVNDVREKVDDTVMEQIVEEVKTDLKDQSTKVLADLKVEIEEQAKADVDKLAKGQLPALLAKLEDKLAEGVRAAGPIVASTTTDRPPVVPEQYQPVDAAGLYYVVAGSSPVKADLESELASVKRKVGGDFGALFPNVAIYPPLGDNTNFALVIDGNLPRAAASDLKRRAIEEGFRSDTFLWKADRVNFKSTTD